MQKYIFTIILALLLSALLLSGCTINPQDTAPAAPVPHVGGSGTTTQIGGANPGSAGGTGSSSATVEESQNGASASGTQAGTPGNTSSEEGSTASILQNSSAGSTIDIAANSSVSPANSTAPPPTIKLTASEVAKHNKRSDCWMIINGVVLDLTSFTSHPGGSTYVPYCGKDGTAAYEDTPHSSRADSMFQYYQLGMLGDEIIIQ